eukprot:TRINITY_DN1481_c0_g1_i2.p1 TRINITY_DN1481_c0_g1~~TRINITY_DN1481_c0_g1_i2.p1  ORF type:complete len:553 (+),score=41.86 TRINITY_DN1481_c0_g1_i2:123-1781(+)
MTQRAQRAFSIVVGTDKNDGIGCNGELPWRCRRDMAFFKALTRTPEDSTSNVVIMGRKTWDSLPANFRPLPDRINIVITRSAKPMTHVASAAASAAIPTAASSLSRHSPTDGASAGAPASDVCADAPSVPKGNPVSAGAPSYASPPDAFAHPSPLPHLVAPTLDAALEEAAALRPMAHSVFVIGGGQVYREALMHPMCNAVIISRITRADYPHLPYPCDTFFPGTLVSPPLFAPCPTHPAHAVFAGTKSFPEDPKVTVQVYQRTNDDEHQYLDLVRRIIEGGTVKADRTGVGTRSTFGAMTRWSLRHGRLPLLTTKKVFLRGVLEELLWFLSGKTDANILSERGIRIWDGNASRQFLDSRGFTTRRVGDLGPVYGFQWRHFGATYRGPDVDYTGEGVDQVAEVLRMLRTDPDSRRMIITAWNPAALPEMALPPCHMLAQFNVNDGELSCMMTQRSADMGLGVPFNVASYAILTRILAHCAGLRPGDLIHTTGDTHIYTNHVEPLRQQLQRCPKPFPLLSIDPSVTTLDDLDSRHFTLYDYTPDPPIKMEMAV